MWGPVGLRREGLRNADDYLLCRHPPKNLEIFPGSVRMPADPSGPAVRLPLGKKAQVLLQNCQLSGGMHEVKQRRCFMSLKMVWFGWSFVAPLGLLKCFCEI